MDVRDQLYGGGWDELERDLRARLEGKPYIFKLATKIEEDLDRIARLRRYEAERGVDLGSVLSRLAGAGEAAEGEAHGQGQGQGQGQRQGAGGSEVSS